MIPQMNYILLLIGLKSCSEVFAAACGQYNGSVSVPSTSLEIFFLVNRHWSKTSIPMSSQRHYIHLTRLKYIHIFFKESCFRNPYIRLLLIAFFFFQWVIPQTRLHLYVNAIAVFRPNFVTIKFNNIIIGE